MMQLPKGAWHFVKVGSSMLKDTFLVFLIRFLTSNKLESYFQECGKALYRSIRPEGLNSLFDQT